jgi:superfamily I DNA and/or RNA helicase
MVLIGDHQQLGPTVRYEKVRGVLGTSLFERLVSIGIEVQFLKGKHLQVYDKILT